MVGIVSIALIMIYNYNSLLFNLNNASSSLRSSSSFTSSPSGQQQEQDIVKPSLVGLREKNSLKVENFVAHGLFFPTSMAFVDDSNILVLEKAGQVHLITNGVLQKQPVLTVPVDNTSERGLLGIAVLKASNSSGGNSGLTDKKNSGVAKKKRTATTI